MNTLSSLQGKQ